MKKTDQKKRMRETMRTITAMGPAKPKRRKTKLGSNKELADARKRQRKVAK